MIHIQLSTTTDLQIISLSIIVGESMWRDTYFFYLSADESKKKRKAKTHNIMNYLEYNNYFIDFVAGGPGYFDPNAKSTKFDVDLISKTVERYKDYCKAGSHLPKHLHPTSFDAIYEREKVLNFGRTPPVDITGGCYDYRPDEEDDCVY